MKDVILFVLLSAMSRYPFWESLSTMFLIGELEGSFKKELPFNAWLVYIDIGILFLLGTFMSFQVSARHTTSFLCAIYLPLHGIVELVLLNQNPVITIHGLINLIGVIATNLLITSGFYRNKAKHKMYLELAYFLFGILFAAKGVVLSTSIFEQSILLYYLPLAAVSSLGRGVILKSFIILPFLCCYGFFSRKSFLWECKVISFVYTILVSLPCDILLMTYLKQPQIWMCCKLIGVDLCTLLGLSLLIIKS